jgi:2-methylcitrate dehydratase PrpD
LPDSVPFHELQTSAKFSIPWVVACALVHGAPWLEHFEPGGLGDSRVRTLMKRVRVVHQPRYDVMPLKMPARVTVTTVHGDVHSAEVEYPPGEPENPLPDAARREKFRRLAASVLAADRVTALELRIDELEELKDLRELLPC